MDEVVRAVRWQRMAPAFGAGQTAVTLSNTVLKDTWLFHKGDSWAAWMVGKIGMQSAPAIVARGIAAPIVKSVGESPFVLASRNPNGAVAIATMQRVNASKGFYFPLADITLNIDTASRIGVFGQYRSLTLLRKKNNNEKIYAQDLAGDKAIDITDLVRHTNNSIILDGKLLKQLGTMSGTEGDVSQPGLFIYIESGL